MYIHVLTSSQFITHCKSPLHVPRNSRKVSLGLESTPSPFRRKSFTSASLILSSLPHSPLRVSVFTRATSHSHIPTTPPSGPSHLRRTTSPFPHPSLNTNPPNPQTPHTFPTFVSPLHLDNRLFFQGIHVVLRSRPSFNDSHLSDLPTSKSRSPRFRHWSCLQPLWRPCSKRPRRCRESGREREIPRENQRSLVQ